MQPPTGQITLVFAEIDGMAELWGAAPELAGIVTEQRDHRMRSLLSEHQGYEVKIEDALFMGAFAEAEHALAFAGAVQQALVEEPWPEALIQREGFGLVSRGDGRPLFAGPRLRMGLHAGSPDPRVVPTTGRTDYFGPVPNRAARIMGAAGPGQVLLSEEVRDALDDPQSLVDLGVHRLSGVDVGVRLYAYPVPGLEERRFPPPETLDAERTNINTRGDRFIGRRTVIASVWEAFEQGHRLVTLMGPTGVGKTRLAQQFGHLELDQFAGGVWFCDLVRCRERNDLLVQIAEALSLPLSAGQDAAATIAASLIEQGPMLLILDNLEQVIDAASDLISDWLDRCPEVQLLCTSQERLRLAEEQVVDLGGLTESEAIALFGARRVEGKQAPITDHERPQIAALVRMLDRVPLAIELAAAQSHRGSIAGLRKRIGEDLAHLETSLPDLPSRHRSLRAAFEWSWSLLSEDERCTMAQISVFRGGFTMDAAEAVLMLPEDAPWVLDLLEALHDKSLLRTVERGHDLRFELNESVRRLAGEQLEHQSGLGATLRARHAAYFCDRGLDDVAGLFGRDASRHLARIRNEQHNLRCVLQSDDLLRRGQATITMASLLKITGPNDLRLAMLEGIEPHWDALPANLRCQLQRAQAEALKESGDLQGAVAVLEAAKASAEEEDNPRLLARVMGTTGLLHRALGQHDRARVAMETALRIARSCDDDPTRGSMLNNLAAIAHDRGQLETCRRLTLEALELAEARGRALGAATARLNLGTMAATSGQHEEALVAYRRAAATFDELGRRGYGTMARALMGLTELDRNSMEEAQRLLKAAQGEAKNLADPTTELIATCWLGLAFWLGGDSKAAAPLIRGASRLVAKTNSPNRYAFAVAFHAAMLARQGRPRGARQALEQARQMASNSGNRDTTDVTKIIAGLAAAYILDDDDYAADPALREELLEMAEKRRRFARRSSPPSDAFPDGLVAPVTRSIDARIALRLLDEQLRHHSTQR